jgi:prevent-host-death family protein
MRTVSLAEAKAKLSELITDAESGQQVEITKRGKVVARLVAAMPARKPLDIDRILEETRKMPMQTESAGEFIRKMRDSDRY